MISIYVACKGNEWPSGYHWNCKKSTNVSCKNLHKKTDGAIACTTNYTYENGNLITMVTTKMDNCALRNIRSFCLCIHQKFKLFTWKTSTWIVSIYTIYTEKYNSVTMVTAQKDKYEWQYSVFYISTHPPENISLGVRNTAGIMICTGMDKQMARRVYTCKYTCQYAGVLHRT